MRPMHRVFVGLMSASAAFAGVAQAADSAGVQVAQTGLAPPSGPTYGYQPYNDRNPTGFYHPEGMGYGSYYMTPKYHGHRIPALHYRKFRGN